MRSPDCAVKPPRSASRYAWSSPRPASSRWDSSTWWRARSGPPPWWPWWGQPPDAAGAAGSMSPIGAIDVWFLDRTTGRPRSGICRWTQDAGDRADLVLAVRVVDFIRARMFDSLVRTQALSKDRHRPVAAHANGRPALPWLGLGQHRELLGLLASAVPAILEIGYGVRPWLRLTVGLARSARQPRRSRCRLPAARPWTRFWAWPRFLWHWPVVAASYPTCRSGRFAILRGRARRWFKRLSRSRSPRLVARLVRCGRPQVVLSAHIVSRRPAARCCSCASPRSSSPTSRSRVRGDRRGSATPCWESPSDANRNFLRGACWRWPARRSVWMS
jgi:hypothetical protein